MKTLLGHDDAANQTVHVAGSVSTLLFDVDDTLYDVSTGFTEDRNVNGAIQFMVKHLDFPNVHDAKLIRDEYFEKYHSSAKALTIAEQEGKFPPSLKNKNVPRFNAKELGEFFATELNFGLLGGPKYQLAHDLKECKLNLAVFSNGPRKYVKRVLSEIGLDDVFDDSKIFAVDDVLPYCKPDREAFETIFERLGVTANECVMIEDSMKNIRKAKELGIKTVLVAGEGNLKKTGNNSTTMEERYDAPIPTDPAVDVTIEKIEELKSVLPGLWEDPPAFVPSRR